MGLTVKSICNGVACSDNFSADVSVQCDSDNRLRVRNDRELVQLSSQKRIGPAIVLDWIKDRDTIRGERDGSSKEVRLCRKRITRFNGNIGICQALFPA